MPAAGKPLSALFFVLHAPLSAFINSYHSAMQQLPPLLHQMKAKTAPIVCAYDHNRGNTMDMNSFFSDLQGKINQAIESSPAKDIEKNVKSMMTQGFAKLDLVTREEFDIQAQVLAKTRARLEALESRLAELEAKAAPQA
jgi:BMFP domain-containing protein YqiC